MNILITSRNYDPLTGRCTYKFPSTTTISGRQVALLSAKFNNSFFNISAALNNNVIVVRYPVYSAADTLDPLPANNPGVITITMADGFYSFEDLNLLLQNEFIKAKFYMYDPASGKNVYFATLRVNPVQYKIQLDTYYTPTQKHVTDLGWVLPAGAPLFVNPSTASSGTPRMTRPQFVISGTSALMGIAAGNWPDGGGGALESATPDYVTYENYTASSTMGATAPEIQSVTGVIVKASIVSSPTAYPVDMLALVPVTAVFGAAVNYEANYPMFVATASGTVSDIVLTFTDQDFNPIKFFDPDVSFTLYIK